MEKSIWRKGLEHGLSTDTPVPPMPFREQIHTLTRTQATSIRKEGKRNTLSKKKSTQKKPFHRPALS